MSTDETPQVPDLETMLKDPLSIPEGVDLETLAAADGGKAPGQTASPDAEKVDDANEQGEKDGDAPGTGEEHGKEGEPLAAEPEPAGVASRDGKHIIPYAELKSTRERAARAEIMAQELTAKVEALQNEIATGRASKTRDIADIVDEDVLEALRDESPEVADVIDKLITRNEQLAEKAQSAHEATADTERESRVQAVVSVEEAINSVPKLAHVRANDPAAFSAIAELDTMLGGRPAWKDKPLADRFDAAVRMYEAANGEIDLPGHGQAPDDSDARVKAAVKAAASTDPSTLSDIPGGEPAAESSRDALTSLSSTALTERFMQMTPEQIEAELARLV